MTRASVDVLPDEADVINRDPQLMKKSLRVPDE